MQGAGNERALALKGESVLFNTWHVKCKRGFALADAGVRPPESVNN